MANRLFVPAKGYLERGVTTLFCPIVTTTSGTIDTAQALGKGIYSIVRNSAGNYTVTLTDQYSSLLHAIPTLKIKSDGTAPAADKGMILTTYGATNFGAAATGRPSFIVQAWLPNLAGAAAVAKDVADANAILLTIMLKDSSLP